MFTDERDALKRSFLGEAKGVQIGRLSTEGLKRGGLYVAFFLFFFLFCFFFCFFLFLMQSLALHEARSLFIRLQTEFLAT